MKRRAIVWFRQDLRIHDNEAIQTALRNADEIIPVYVFDERIFTGKTHFGFRKTERQRAQFILESIADLRQNLRNLGSDLIIRIGKPEEILPEIAYSAKVEWIVCNRERTRDEVAIQDAVEQKLWILGVELWYSRGKMLYYTQDLPMPVNHTPDTFTQFRKENESLTPIRLGLPSPTFLPKIPEIGLEPGDIPILSDFGYTAPITDMPSVFKGGETEALKRLRYFLWEKDLIVHFKETRNTLGDPDGSSRFSSWLAQGCLSPKFVYHELKRYEHERQQNESTYLLVYELLWRDFLRLMGKKHGSKIFLKGGPRNTPDQNLTNDWDKFQLWAEGKTGMPLIDANMRELAATGWISGKGRQLVAHYLIKELKVNWQMGAEWFESLLLDYDPCSNWGNWNLAAGVSSDNKEDRTINLLSQMKTLDPKGEYVKKWCPELDI